MTWLPFGANRICFISTGDLCSLVVFVEAEILKSHLVCATRSYKSHALAHVECSHVLGAHMSLCMLFQETEEPSENV